MDSYSLYDLVEVVHTEPQSDEEVKITRGGDRYQPETPRYSYDEDMDQDSLKDDYRTEDNESIIDDYIPCSPMTPPMTDPLLDFNQPEVQNDLQLNAVESLLTLTYGSWKAKIIVEDWVEDRLQEETDDHSEKMEEDPEHLFVFPFRPRFDYLTKNDRSEFEYLIKNYNTDVKHTR